LLIAKENIDLNKEITITQEMFYPNEDQYVVGKNYPISDLINKMLTVSNNTAANALIIELGGASSVDQKAKTAGLKSINFKTLFTGISGNPSTTGRYANATDLANSIRLIFGESGTTAQAVQNALKGNKTKFGYSGDIGHKHGNTTTTFANIGQVDWIGKKYFVAASYKLNSNKYGSTSGDFFVPKSGNPIDQFFEALKSKLAVETKP
jgi:beta-lactamase class A